MTRQAQQGDEHDNQILKYTFSKEDLFVVGKKIQFTNSTLVRDISFDIVASKFRFPEAASYNETFCVRFLDNSDE